MHSDYPHEGKVKVTIQETSTEVQPVYPGYNLQEQNSLIRSSELHRSYANGHTASSATKELDDLMASLSEFKVINLKKKINKIYKLFILFINNI